MYTDNDYRICQQLVELVEMRDSVFNDDFNLTYKEICDIIAHLSES